MNDQTLFSFSEKTNGHDKGQVNLYSPTLIPKASGFLWNAQMMLQVNCRGFVTAQFMQPEASKYSRGPALEANTFMQPEQGHYAHHPGRFFYVRDEDNGSFFSVPYEPVRQSPDKFCFTVGPSEVCWQIEHAGLAITLTLTLAKDHALEMWSLRLTNISERPRNISIYPYFTIGYMSWMNQSATFNDPLNALIADSITPYQKVEDYFKNQQLKDQTFLLSDQKPDAWCANQANFEGEGGLHNPDALAQPLLDETMASYETPVAAMQFQSSLQDRQSTEHRFLFGPAKDSNEIKNIREQYFSTPQSFTKASNDYQEYIQQGQGCLHIETPDKHFNQFVNHWLPRQMFYHGDVNRLSTDPQTRNLLQDNMGMSYIKPASARQAFITALSQQQCDGSMPDGILLHANATLKYINQVPHTDHCIWLPICLLAYLEETNDIELLNEPLPFADDSNRCTVFEHIERAMEWLLQARDQRGLSLIGQGDWCDPMNMAGYKGSGTSTWLSLATAYALQQWINICHWANNTRKVDYFRQAAEAINSVVNQYCWDGRWYNRGFTDEGIAFGVQSDKEGRIYLNPQSWALLSGAAKNEKAKTLISEVEKQLDTPFGVMMLAPSYTGMRDDIGRITQKYPGTAENGSIYNHAAAFYAYSLYQQQEPEKAFDVLNKMLPTHQDAIQRGQLPVFIPNYYRGAYHQNPNKAGLSSHLFNTGTIAWFYRCLIDGLLGLKGNHGALTIQPQLPKHWHSIKVCRRFAGATFNITMTQTRINSVNVTMDGELMPNARIDHIKAGHHYEVQVFVPKTNDSSNIAA